MKLWTLILCLVLAGCAAPGSVPVHPDQDGPIHGESGGGGSGGSM